MGRSILFIPGIRDLDDVQTIAGLTILGSIAKLAAQYETKINVPVCTSMVMSNGREVVKEAFLSVGRPDLYNDDIVHYITDEQFGYVAAVDGIMVRDKPATCFYMGAFFAESLILAETGNYADAASVLRSGVRLYADRRGVVCGIGISIRRPAADRIAQRAGHREDAGDGSNRAGIYIHHTGIIYR